MAISLDSLKASLHDVAIKDSTNGYELSIDSNGYITSIINGSVTVTATDLDIRDLSSGTDSISAVQSGSWSVDLDSGAAVQITDGTDTLEIDSSGFITANINGDVNVTQGTSPWVVSATDLDIRDLAFATDSVTAHQGGSWSFTLDNISSWKNTAVTATTTATEYVATPLTGRIKALIQNLGAQDVYVGPDNSLTTANGTLIPKGSSYEMNFDTGADIWLVTGSSTSDVRISEYAA